VLPEVEEEGAGRYQQHEDERDKTSAPRGGTRVPPPVFSIGELAPVVELLELILLGQRRPGERPVVHTRLLEG
jgi:hypothetical protein